MDTLDDVYCYDIDDLKQVVDANIRERAREAQRAEALVEREVGEVRGAACATSRSSRPSCRCASAWRRSASPRSARRWRGCPRPRRRRGRRSRRCRAAIVNKILHAPDHEAARVVAGGRRPLVARAGARAVRAGAATRDPASARARARSPWRRRASWPTALASARARGGDRADAHGGRPARRGAAGRVGRQGPLRARDRGGAAARARSTSPCTASRTCPPSCPPGSCSPRFPPREDPRDVLVTGARRAARRRCAPGARRRARRAPGAARCCWRARPDLAVEPAPRQRRHAAARSSQTATATRSCWRRRACVRLGLQPAHAAAARRRTSSCPRWGRGSLAVEARARRRARRAGRAARRVDHPATRVCALAERAYLAPARRLLPSRRWPRTPGSTAPPAHGARVVASEDGRQCCASGDGAAATPRAWAAGAPDDAAGAGRDRLAALAARAPGRHAALSHGARGPRQRRASGRWPTGRGPLRRPHDRGHARGRAGAALQRSCWRRRARACWRRRPS